MTVMIVFGHRRDLCAFDFQRLRQSKDLRTAPLLAASIFLDILNVFLFFLSFGDEE